MRRIRQLSEGGRGSSEDHGNSEKIEGDGGTQSSHPKSKEEKMIDTDRVRILQMLVEKFPWDGCDERQIFGFVRASPVWAKLALKYGHGQLLGYQRFRGFLKRLSQSPILMHIYIAYVESIRKEFESDEDRVWDADRIELELQSLKFNEARDIEVLKTIFMEVSAKRK